MFVVFFYQSPTYWSPKPRIIQASLNHMYYNTFSCLSPHCMVFSAWKTPTGRKDNCCLYLHDPSSVPPAKFYTRKDIVIMKISISFLCTCFFTPEIQRFPFHLTHVWILGTHHCGNTRREAFKYPCAFQDVLGWCDYSERVVASFAHQIQSE